jgi:tetratricopeptide repeat protein
VFYVAIEDEQPPEIRTRRAVVLAGIGLVWTAFMASVGLVVLALLVLVGAAAGAAWILGMRLPRVDLRGVAGRARMSGVTATGRVQRAGRRTAVRSRALGAAAAHGTRALSGHLVAPLRTRGTSAFRHLAATVGRASATASQAKQSARLPRITLPSLNRRPDPRIEEALASNSEGIALAKAGRHAEAIDAFDTALALLAETDDRHHEGQVLANLGTVHRKVGGTEAARFCWTRALERLEPGTPESERTAELLGVR